MINIQSIQDILNDFTPAQLSYLKRLATKKTTQQERPRFFQDNEVANLLTAHFNRAGDQCQWLSLKDIMARIQLPLDKPRGNSIMRVSFKRDLKHWLESLPQGLNTKQASTTRSIVYYYMPPFKTTKKN